MCEEAPGFRPGPRVMTRAQARWDRVVLQRLKPECHKLLSTFALNSNLRPYPTDDCIQKFSEWAGYTDLKVSRCRLILSNPR